MAGADEEHVGGPHAIPQLPQHGLGARRRRLDALLPGFVTQLSQQDDRAEDQGDREQDVGLNDVKQMEDESDDRGGNARDRVPVVLSHPVRRARIWHP
jgi:hypothetical protein